MAGESEEPGGDERVREKHGVLDWQCGSGPVAKSELDAARTLADLSRVTVIVSGNDSVTADRWGVIGRRRSRRRLKDDENTVTLSQIQTWDPPHSQSSLLENHQNQKNICNYLELEPVKALKDSEVPKSRPSCSVIHGLSNRGKAKQNLTEAEKESRRLRRILANRESARQTIRRRQALYEELTKKASDLACDNESLNHEKELIMKEYRSLKDKNKILKAQSQKVIKEEVDPNPEMMSTNTEKRITSSSFVQLPTFKYNNRIPYPPCFWPCVCPIQTHFALNMTSESKNSKPNHEFLDPSRVCGSGMPLCLVPYPWFYPVPSCDFRPVDPSRSREADEDKEKGKHAARMIETPFSIIKPKLESSSEELLLKEEESTTNNIREAQDLTVAADKDMTRMPAPLRSLPPKLPVKSEHFSESDMDFVEHHSSTNSNIEISGETVSASSSAFPVKSLVVDGAMAAAARKRRKELTKLKQLHSRQHRMHS
ncbi:uncharacterized protein [Aristolochia californica]|uniref:uncharacterized protein n=1 Tax=Aristolochia californica TaxID=171875 RepID=UPI0035DB58F7